MEKDQMKELMRALRFAAEKHATQRRKDAAGTPYINHPIAVAETLARVGGVQDLEMLQAALLHDTVEDTGTKPEELELQFGRVVRDLVMEMTDDKSLEKEVRKRLQIEHAAHLSAGAKQIKLCDKICNVSEINREEPRDWPLERKAAYFDWAEKVVAGCRGVNRALEERFDQVVREQRARLNA